ncbi:unnamed protein product [Rotaria sp. Silwood2]|nr:unnamed protein product [Rotaria sp. Silwood2]CAF2780944.1 unnamed protein product [Rotaria sp. Silwood2]CAF3019087.1 unnamed protein product [Rotaria sp. Silwood2]CAF3047670.1 unnamed protein product [Rotaria sp. Silwood2]CAF3887138.1 unnamed protein product [Rotaria sp. Silwood2]
MENYPLLETMLSFYKLIQASDEDLLMLTFHYCLLTNGFKVSSPNQPSEILNLSDVENSVPIHYIFDGFIVKCDHNTVVTEKPPDIEFGTNQGREIEDGVYSVEIQINGDAWPFLEEFVIDDYLNKHTAGTTNSVQNIIKDIPGFMEKSMNVISSLKEYIRENKQRLIDQQADHQQTDHRPRDWPVDA